MRLRIDSGERAGEIVEIEDERFVIGREAGCDLAVDDPDVSRRHALIRRTEAGDYVVEDLGSTNGTRVDAQKIEEPFALAAGQRIKMGDTVLTVLAVTADRTVIRGASAAEPAGQATTIRPAAGSGGAPPGAAAPPPPPPPPPPPSAGQPAGAGVPDRSASRIQSAIERVRLQRNVQRAMILAGAALGVAVLVIVLAVAGVFGGGDDMPTVAQVVQKTRPKTALVISYKDKKRFANGSGWVYDADKGLVVTNAHVINGGETFKVAVGGKTREADVVAAAPCEDIALLKLSKPEGLQAVELGKQSDIEEGTEVVALGYPTSASASDNLTSTAGVVSVAKTKLDKAGAEVAKLTDVIQTDAAINPGNSGGPLVTRDGTLVGMNSAGVSSLQSTGYAIGVDRIKTVVDRLKTGKSIGWTGIGFEFPDASELKDRGLPQGLIASSAVPGTPAAKAGFGKSAVIVTAINGHALNVNLTSYCSAVKDLQSGSTTLFNVYTSGGDTGQVRVGFD